MDFLIILAFFLGIVWIASKAEQDMRRRQGPGAPGAKICPPHPWRPRRQGDPAGTHYLICDKCQVEPSFVGRDTPQK